MGRCGQTCLAAHSPLPLQSTSLNGLVKNLEDTGWFSGAQQGWNITECGCLRGGGVDGDRGVRTGCCDGAGVSVQLWGLSLASDLILFGPQPS